MRIGFLGDFFPSKINDDLKINDSVISDYKKSTILSILAKNDFNLANLECPITKSNNLIKKTGKNIKCNEKSISLIKESDISHLSIANNHIKDFGIQGIQDTIAICRDNKIEIVGAGISKQESQESMIIENKDIKVGIISIADDEFNEWTKDSGGSNSFNVIDIYEQIKQLNQNTDHIIIFSHAGIEHFHYPTPRIKKMYRFLSKLEGVSAIIAHHPHCIQGYEVNNGVPIFYSIGNSFSPNTRGFDQGNFGMLINMDFSKNNFNYDIIHFKQCKNNFRIDILENEENINQIKLLNNLSEIVENDDLLYEKWSHFISHRKYSYIKSLLPFNKIIIGVLNRTGLLRFILNTKFLLLILNNIRSDVRRENLIHIIKKLLKNK